MKELIKDIYEILKNFRSDETFVTQITEDRIEKWINQFKKDDRKFLLKELKSIFQKLYFSKKRAKKFLAKVVKKLSLDLGYPNVKEFLANAKFLDLQEKGKSQKKLLELLKSVLEEKFKYKFSDVGNKSEKHCVYIDDVLCTGTTFYNNITQWLNTETNGKKQIDRLRSNEINLSVMYIFIATEYYNKKIGQFYYNADKNFRNMLRTYSMRWHDEEVLKPINLNQPTLVKDYEAQVIKEADEHANGRWHYNSNFYRPQYETEELFSSKENRLRFENILLEKGVEILNNANSVKKNIRPLGFSLPSYKDFGFGALFFTWRNIANNTPLVFWYAGGGFLPLFIKR